MKFDQKKIISSMPSIFGEIFQLLKQDGFTPTLVGGAVRDFFLKGSFGHDLDFEVSHATHTFNKDQWKNLARTLSHLGKVSFLPYEIIRLDIQGTQFEFSPPRVETFKAEWESAGHSNFTADFDFKLPFEVAIKRRDFTINAMGLRFSSPKDVELLDPLNGLMHLRDKLLHHCSSDFIKDPVRFLRAIRFSVKMHFSFTPELKSVLERMPLQSLGSSYLWLEMQKSLNPIVMLKQLLDWQQIHPEFKLPLDFQSMSLRWEELSRVLIDPSRHESWIIALEWIGLSGESWQKFFSVSSETSSRLRRWALNSKKFIHLKPEVFHGEFDTIRERAEFNLLFDWYFTTKQLLQKNTELPLLKMIEDFVPDWIHLYRFEVVKDVKHIDPPLRAKYQVWNLCQRL